MAVELGDDAIERGGEGVLHLHGLERQQLLAVGASSR
jgi:hypothetical protein